MYTNLYKQEMLQDKLSLFDVNFKNLTFGGECVYTIFINFLWYGNYDNEIPIQIFYNSIQRKLWVFFIFEIFVVMIKRTSIHKSN